MSQTRYAVVGGGIVGLAVAYKLTRKFPGASVTVLEKEAGVGRHQTGHNSGVLHCGLPYKPGSLKAQLAVSGIRQMTEFCQQNSIAHEICGNLVVAASEEEVPRLRDLLDRGTKNGLQGLRWLTPEQMREIEPHAGGVAGLHVPEEGIVDYGGVCTTLQRLVEQAGGSVRTGAPVKALRQLSGHWIITTPTAEVEADYLFNSAGLQSDRVLEMAGERRGTRIVPFRGEYYLLNEEGRKLVRHLIYPVADPAFPFLGVHFTRRVGGGIEAGPNAVLATAREGYHITDFNLRDAADIFSYQGIWRFLGRYPRMCVYEIYRSLSKSEFCRSLQRLVPEIGMQHLARGGSGVRAQAVTVNGDIVHDFEYVQRPNALHLISAPSPAATASLAIADHLMSLL
jgi:L-2-hydroxyglutarate oxidase